MINAELRSKRACSQVASRRPCGSPGLILLRKWGEIPRGGVLQHPDFGPKGRSWAPFLTKIRSERSERRIL